MGDLIADSMVYSTKKLLENTEYKNHPIVALENGKEFVVNGRKFYQIGKNQFVKVANTVLQAAKRVQLTHNAFVYDQKGHVVKKHGKPEALKKGKWIKAYNNADKFVINGKVFYKVGENRFVKVANTRKQKAKKVKLTHNAFLL